MRLSNPPLGEEGSIECRFWDAEVPLNDWRTGECSFGCDSLESNLFKYLAILFKSSCLAFCAGRGGGFVSLRLICMSRCTLLRWIRWLIDLTYDPNFDSFMTVVADVIFSLAIIGEEG